MTTERECKCRGCGKKYTAAVRSNHRLLCGDSGLASDVDRLLDGATVHMVNSDPPYNVRLMYRVSA